MYQADEKRYEKMIYPRLGKSGVCVSKMALGLWQNFGEDHAYAASRDMVLYAFDHGVNHFDLANNYGNPAGSAEETFGKILKKDLHAYRDELFIATKAGYDMWPGPFGDHGSKKYLIASLDQSLQRMGLEYVDVFYHHRPDPDTPLEETAEALEQIVRQGKALYVGISNYSVAQTQAMLEQLKQRKVHCLLHQVKYSMLERQAEQLFPVLEQEGVGSIAFSPLAQGLLTGKYISQVPAGSRMDTAGSPLGREALTPERRDQLLRLNEIAQQRGQTMSQFALCWAIRAGAADTLILGARNAGQLQENLDALKHTDFSAEELAAIEDILS